MEAAGQVLVCKSRKTWWSREKTTWSVRIADVLRVVAYKVDHLTTDQVRFDLEMPDGLHYTVTEDDPAWHALLSSLGHLPEFDHDWRAKVIQPPFASCDTVVFQRS